MKIIVLAEVCNPEWPSLPSFSYALVKSLSNFGDVTLITHVRNKSALEKQKHALPCEINFIDNEWVGRPFYLLSSFFEKLGLGGLMTQMALGAIPYIVFERMAYKMLRKRVKSGEFDVAIRISPVSPTIPSPFPSLDKLPFILGPINGGLRWPEGFPDVVKREGELIRRIRSVYRIFPYYKSTYEKSTHILASFKHVLPDIPNVDRSKVTFFDELGVYSDRFKPRDRVGDGVNTKCVFIFVGRLVPLKCVDVLVSAFVRSDFLRQGHQLLIIGDGPERPIIEGLVKKGGIKDNVILTGWKDKDEVAQLLCESDVFVFPTIREAGGNVILEAMSAGLPCIVSSYGGPEELVDDATGIRVPLSTKEQLVTDFENAMVELAENVVKRKKMACAARKKAVEVFDWEAKGRRLFDICQRVVTKSSEDP